MRPPVARPPTPVPESEIKLDFVRSSGPGGQNVNKTSSKVQLRWHVGGSASFTEAQKAAIRTRAGRRLNAADEVVISAETERSQSQNRAEVVRRLQELVAAALTPRKTRKPTRVSKSQKRQRLDAKRQVAQKKRDRKPSQKDW
jgi:ribosome-associated protein